MQNTVGSDIKSLSMLTTAIQLKEKGGWGIFFDGITPKLFRAAVNHSVTFYVYELIIKFGSTI